MKNRGAVFGVALARQFGKIPAKILAMTGNELRQDAVAKLGEEGGVAGNTAAIEERDVELGIIGAKLAAFTESSRCRADAHAHVPKFLANYSRGILEARFGGGILAEEQQIDIGIWEESATSVAAESDDGNFSRIPDFRRRRPRERAD